MNLEMESEEMHKLKWAGIFSEELVGLEAGTPAQILEHILKKVWTLDPHEKDMIVMWHKFTYLEEGKEQEINATMVATGDDEVNTAMSKTVGLPMAIATRLLTEGKLKSRGVKIPIEAELYKPALKELKDLGFDFMEVKL